MKKCLFILLVLCSCSKKDKHFEKLLEGHGQVYWSQKELQVDGKYKYANNQWIFFVNGTAALYNSADENKIGLKSLAINDDHGKGRWKYNKSDSTFDMCSTCNFKVYRYTDDTVFMRNGHTNIKYLLVKHML